MKLKKLISIFILITSIYSIIICNNSYATDLVADSPAAILINSNTGKIMYEKNAYKTMYPASTTKIMTAIIAIEKCNLTDIAIVSQNALNLPAGYLGSSLQVGEELSIKELLYLLLLDSSNDGAIVLAEHIAGSVENFANMMNEKAKEIGCKNTHFVNSNGVHNTNHYTTAYDLSLIAQYAMKNETFRKIVACSEYTIPSTNKYEERDLKNTNKLLREFISDDKSERNIYYYKYAIGIKTGYTTVANNCLVAAAKKDNTEYIAVVLGAAKFENKYSSQRYSDTKKLFETAFNNYTLYNVKKSGEIISTIKIENGNFMKKNLDLILEKDIQILMNNEDLNSELNPDITLNNDKIKAPIKKGDIVGTVTYTYDNVSYTENLIAKEDIHTNEQMYLFLKIGLGVIIVIIIYKKIKHRK